MKKKSVDIFILILFYFSIIIGFYYNGLSQSNLIQGLFITPMPVLLLPFGVVVLQLYRILFYISKNRLNIVAKVWVLIFIYYIVAFVIGDMYGREHYKYITYWFVVCPPVSWVYFSLVLKNSSSFSKILISWSFWILIILSLIALYFIPRSLTLMGLYAPLNTGYYVLFAYPMAMLNKSTAKRVISTILMVIVVLLSMKRGGIAAMAVAFFLYALFSSSQSIAKKTILIVVFAVALFYLVPYINNISEGTLETRIERTFKEDNDEARTTMYPILWHKCWDSSLTEITLGHGHNAVASDNVIQGYAAHNDFLEFLYDYGVIGLVLLLIYHFQLIKLTFRSRKYKNCNYPTVFALSIILVLSLVSIVYAYEYFLIIIPFWCLMNNNMKEIEAEIKK